jgi:hypothetical protein
LQHQAAMHHLSVRAILLLILLVSPAAVGSIGTLAGHRQTETRLFVEKQVDDLRITIR